MVLDDYRLKVAKTQSRKVLCDSAALCLKLLTI